jgi:KDO2-lipid IV(A) lauroyltransferase
LSKPLVQHFLELLSHASLRTLYRLGDMLAFVAGNTPNRLSRTTRQNIALCFPELDSTAQRRLYRRSIRHTCYSAVEVAAVWCWPMEKIQRHITEVEICDSFDACTRGRIILLPHLGSWETLAVWLGQRINVMYLYKQHKNKSIDAFVKQARARTGGIPVPTEKHGLRQLLTGLKRGGSAVILPDQRPRENKVRTESTFFGLSAPTSTLVQNLCAKLDCEVFIAIVYRTAPLGNFGLCLESLDRTRLAGDRQESARYMNEQIEQWVRRFPEQYNWGYRRFSNHVYESANRE